MRKVSGNEPENTDQNAAHIQSANVSQKLARKSVKKKKTAKQIAFLKRLALRPKKPKEYKTCDEMTALGIPDFLQHSYLTGLPMPQITELREWQKNLFLSEDWKQ